MSRRTGVWDDHFVNTGVNPNEVGSVNVYDRCRAWIIRKNTTRRGLTNAAKESMR
jgi:hypothetical protein